MSLVCWSGGHDSTLVLYNLAKNATSNNPVRSISIISQCIPSEGENRRAREKILNRMRNEKLPVDHAEIRIGEEKGLFQKGDGLFQPLLWIPIATNCLAKDEDLYLGYIEEDCVWHYRANIVTFFSQMQGIGGKNGEIKFPLEWHKKEDVIKELKEASLLELCWTCEYPTKESKACGTCIPCTNLARAHWILEYKKSKEEKPAKIIKKIHKALKKKIKKPV